MVLAGLAALHYHDPTRLNLIMARYVDTPGYYIVGKVPVVHWEPTKKFAREIPAGRTPVVLRNTVVATWPALHKWTPEFLSDRVDMLSRVYRHTNKTFTFFDNTKPYAAFPDVVEDLMASHKIVRSTLSAPHLEGFGLIWCLVSFLA